jgi:hypothetical protein
MTLPQFMSNHQILLDGIKSAEKIILTDPSNTTSLNQRIKAIQPLEHAYDLLVWFYYPIILVGGFAFRVGMILFYKRLLSKRGVFRTFQF